ncbi:hypothetical protein KAU39_00055 [bacterium]|nr:hypothetical protein [bacterium]
MTKIEINYYSTLIIAIICLFCNSHLCAHFEEMGAGARCIGRGKNFVAVCDDVYSLYYNPAGLSQLNRKELTTSCGKIHWGLDDDSNLINSLCLYAHPLEFGNKETDERSSWGTIGIGWLNFILADFYQEDTIILSYGKKLYKNYFAGGINFKYLAKKFGKDDYTRIDPLFSKGTFVYNYSLDISGLYNLNDFFSFGLILTDINQPDLGLKEKDEIPAGFKLGSVYKQKSFNAGLDVYYRDNNLKFYGGGEKWFLQKLLGVRGGFGIGDQSYRNLTCGMSWVSPMFQVDYAFAYPISGIEETYGSHQLSFTMRFGQEVKIQRIFSKKEKKFFTTHLRKGIDLYQKKRLSEALSTFNNIFSVDPHHELAHKYVTTIKTRITIETKTLYDKASSFYKKNLWRKAEKVWQNILIINPAEIQAKTFIKTMRQKLEKSLQLGTKSYQLGKYSQAIREWEKISKVYPNYPLVEENIQKALVKLKEEKIAVKKDIIQKYIKEGQNFYHKKNYSAAIKKWKQALNLDPGQKEASRLFKELGNKLFQDGRLLYQKGEFNQAVILWTKLLEIIPSHTEAKIAIGQTRKEFIEKTNKLYQQGVNEYNAGKYLEAITLWEKALIIIPENHKIKEICMEAYLAQGIFYYRENDLKEAVNMWEKALLIQTHHEKALKYLKRAKTKIKKLEQLK